MYWFLLGILGCVILANIFPSFGANHGPWMPELTVALICFTSGLSLNFKELVKATSSFRVHIFVMSFTFVLFPMFVIFTCTFLRIFGVNEWILRGLVVLSCMPPPVSSAIILTRAAGGNEAAAILISIIGNALGIIFTPTAILSLLGSTAVISIPKSVLSLAQTVLLPLMIGQALQYCDCITCLLEKLPLSVIGQAALLLIIFTTFCDSFTTHDAPMNASDIMVTILLIVLLQIIVLYSSYHLACRFDNLLTREDIVAITFCSTHKSLAFGVPMLRIMFAGYSHFSLITLPLLVYHPSQIVLGGFLAPLLKQWIHEKRARKEDWTGRRASLVYSRSSFGFREKFFGSFRLMPCLKQEDLV